MWRWWSCDRAILMDPLILLGLIVIIGAVPATLWWWKIADRWADGEHKRFATKPRRDPNAGAKVIPSDHAEPPR